MMITLNFMAVKAYSMAKQQMPHSIHSCHVIVFGTVSSPVTSACYRRNSNK